jgi:hypothetical protein
MSATLALTKLNGTYYKVQHTSREREEDINTQKMIKQWTTNYRRNSKATPSRGLRCQTLSLPNLATSLLSLGFHPENIKVGKIEPLGNTFKVGNGD